MSQKDLRSLTRAGDDEQKEILSSDLHIAASGRHLQAPAVVSALREASIPLRMEPAKPCEQKEQDPSLLSVPTDASTEQSTKDLTKVSENESKEAPLSDLLTATSGKCPLVPANACVLDRTSAKILVTMPGNLASSYRRNKQTEEYPPEDRGPGPPSLLDNPVDSWFDPSDTLETIVHQLPGMKQGWEKKPKRTTYRC